MKTQSKPVILPLLATMVVWTTVGEGAETVNVLSNGGFEEGLAGWEADSGHTLVGDSGEAHSGESCLMGEVDGPSQARILRRRVPVKASNRYQFEIWAKATNRTKLVLRAVLPGTDPTLPASKTRTMIAAWDRIGRRWQKYTAPLEVSQDGVLELNIVAPSSHSAPAGKMWIDDVALDETPMPLVTNVSENVGFNDEAAIAIAGDESIWLAYNSFRDGADSLQVARLRLEGKRFQKLGSWPVLGGKGTYILGLRAVATDDRAFALYASEKNKNWDVYAMSCSADGPCEPIRITSDAAVDVKPAAAWHKGTLWIAWESNRGGRRRIFAASLRDGRVSQPIDVGQADSSCYDPSIAVLASGQVCVAWHGFRENNYDVYLRRIDGSGSVGEISRLTTAPTIDRHPLLVAHGDELWLIYENALMGTEEGPYRIGATTTRRLIVAKVTLEGLLVPKDHFQRSPLFDRREAPAAAFDSAGRLWVTYRKPRGAKDGWDAFATCFDGSGWQTPTLVSSQKGMDRTACLALAGDRAVVAFQGDDVPRRWDNEELSGESSSNVYLAALDPHPEGTRLPPVERMELEPLVEPDDAFPPGEIRVARGEDTPTPSINYQGRRLKLFFGDLHDHTDVSPCNRLGDESVDESYQNMRDIVHHDFACATDHGYNINAYLWYYLAKLARTNDDPNNFLTFLGEEWTSTFEEYSAKHPYGFYGHRNLIFADPYFPRWWNARNRQTPAEVWEDLRKMNANFVHIPHQLADTGNVPTDWDFTDEVAQPVAEIFQGRGSYEYKGTPREARNTTPGPGAFIQDAWARGIVIGVIASPDHSGGYGKACVFAPELSREAILDALRARRCYGTTAAKIFLDVRVDGHLMGEKLSSPAGESVTVEIRACCPAEIDRIEVCRNNRFIYTSTPKGQNAELTFVDRDPLDGRSYYYVRVVQEDEEIAWSSPVWFAAP